MVRAEHEFPPDDLLKSSADEILQMERRIQEIAKNLGADQSVRLSMGDIFNQMWRLLKVPLVECVRCGCHYPSPLAAIEDFEFRCDRCAGNMTELKQGLRMSSERYEAIRSAILDVVAPKEKSVLFKDLPNAVAARVPKELFEGASIAWYTTAVKLDLEERGVIERIPGSHPQGLRRTPTRRKTNGKSVAGNGKRGA